MHQAHPKTHFHQAAQVVLLVQLVPEDLLAQVDQENQEILMLQQGLMVLEVQKHQGSQMAQLDQEILKSRLPLVVPFDQKVPVVLMDQIVLEAHFHLGDPIDQGNQCFQQVQLDQLVLEVPDCQLGQGFHLVQLVQQVH